MRKAGGIIALIAGILGFFAALFTLFVGGIGGAFEADGAETVVYLGWGGVFFSFMVIILGAVQIGVKGKITPTLLIFSSVAGIILGGTFVALCLALSLIGGVLGLFDKKEQQITAGQNTSEAEKAYQPSKNYKKIALLASLGFVIVLILLGLISSGEDKIKNSEVAAYNTITTARPTHDIESYIPSEQSEFVRIIENARAAYNAAQNDMAKGGIRSERKQAICNLLKSGYKENWIGSINELSSNSEGKGVLSVSIGEKITLETWNNALSDFSAQTLIDPHSELFKTVSKLQEGDEIVFSGHFFAGDNDCIEEQSFTLNGSLKTPSFTFQFVKVMPFEQYVVQIKGDNMKQIEASTSTYENSNTQDDDEQIKDKKIISPNNFDAYVEMEPEEELEPIATISVVKISKKSGFLMKDVSAKMNLNDENDSSISLKNGTEISVTGKSSDDKFYEVSTSAINQPLYVPLDSVALFGD